MVFVPVVPPPPPSRRSQELGARIRESIETYVRENPGMSPGEIRAAADLALASVRGETGARNAMLAVLIAATGGLSVFLIARFFGSGGPIVILSLLVAFATVGLALGLALRNR